MTHPYGLTPAQRLSDRRWRLRHSLWLLGPILGASLLTGVAFLYIGIKARRRAWWIVGIGYVVVLGIGASLADSDVTSTRSDWSAGILATVWIGGMVHALLVNKDWLRWRAQNADPWYVQEQVAATDVLPSPNPVPPEISGLGVDTDRFYSDTPPAALHDMPPTQARPPATPPPAPSPGAPSRPPEPSKVDVNTATTSDLTRLPGIDLDRAAIIISTRERSGPFPTPEAFAAAGDLAPHEFSRVRNLVVCGPGSRPQSPGQSGRPGRVLDV